MNETFKRGDRVVVVSDRYGGKYVGIEGEVKRCKDQEYVRIRVYPDTIANSDIRSRWNKHSNNWTFYYNVYTLELVDAGNKVDDWD